jgi:hypothetical protein
MFILLLIHRWNKFTNLREILCNAASSQFKKEPLCLEKTMWANTVLTRKVAVRVVEYTGKKQEHIRTHHSRQISSEL